MGIIVSRIWDFDFDDGGVEVTFNVSCLVDGGVEVIFNVSDLRAVATFRR